jgi:hypothetical protein
MCPPDIAATTAHGHRDWHTWHLLVLRGLAHMAALDAFVRSAVVAPDPSCRPCPELFAGLLQVLAWSICIKFPRNDAANDLFGFLHPEKTTSRFQHPHQHHQRSEPGRVNPHSPFRITIPLGLSLFPRMMRGAVHWHRLV